MSSEGSVVSEGSRIRQFGLYRTIDARTEEFLKASRKRQIRQGCACAAISTVITVTVVIVILLIYEYTIAVEWSVIHSNRFLNKTNNNDQPFADRLDRSYFGFDQDYYERMPLLINALQESSYYDPLQDTTTPVVKRKMYNITIIKSTTPKPKLLKTNTIRRTSPRPFFFEYRSPTPLPFSKNHNSRNWVERYRNEERLKNIRQLVKYLENTIHAKVGDMYTKPSSTHIAFTGLYIEPMLENKSLNGDSISPDLKHESSNNVRKFQSNHIADPLFNFKPENPGDVNLLADDFLRFSPVPLPTLTDTLNRRPLFRQIPDYKRNCFGSKCEENNNPLVKLLQSSSEIQQTVSPPLSTSKSFSVMLNLYPFKHNMDDKKVLTTTSKSLDNIYLTTSRPLIQFKRKSNVAFRRTYPPYKRPRYLSNLINKKPKPKKGTEIEKENNIETENVTQMIVHVKVYEKNETNEVGNHTYTTPFTTQTNPYTTKAPIELSTSQIEDYHAGSSGYIPVEQTKTETTSLPKVTTLLPFFETTTGWSPPWNGPTEVVKFNPEDAKVPNQYLEIDQYRDTHEGEIQVSRRNSGAMSSQHYEEPSTLVVKLKNVYVNSTESNKITTSKIEDTTTIWTYVPQINGHSRSINQNSENVNQWLNANPEIDSKKRLEESVSGFHNYVPKYVEIKRNNTQNNNENHSEDIVDNDYDVENGDN